MGLHMTGSTVTQLNNAIDARVAIANVAAQLIEIDTDGVPYLFTPAPGAAVPDLENNVAAYVAAGGTFQTALSAAIAAYAPPKAATPTLEELRQTIRISEGSLTAFTTRILYVTDATMVRLDQLSLAVTAAVTASTANFWTVSLVAYRAGGVALTFASKTTKPTANGGEPLSAFTGWNFDLTTFSAFDGFVEGDVLVMKVTPTGTPDPLVGPVVSYRMAPVDVVPPLLPVSVSDSFTRGDNATSLGSTETGGKTWQNFNYLGQGAWGISSNRAYCSTLSSGPSVAVIDTGVPDGTVQVRLATMAASTGLALRMTSANTGITLNQTAVFRNENGVVTQIGTYSTGFVAGDTMQVVMTGDVLTVNRQAGSTGSFAQVLQVTEPFNDSATLHGIRSSSTGNFFDDFLAVWP